MHTLLYIDEDEEAADDFADYVDDLGYTEKIKLLCELPKDTLEGQIDRIGESKADAVVVDYMLNDIREYTGYNVPYTGVELLHELNKRREGFPQFVVTSFDDDAIKASDDVNVIYEKAVLQTEKGTGPAPKTNFMERVMTQVAHYKASLESAKEELADLIKESKSKDLNSVQIDRVNELDRFLEGAFGKHSKIPDELRGGAVLSTLNNLVKETENLIERLENE